MIDLSINYNVLHQHPLGWQAAGQFAWEKREEAKAEGATETEKGNAAAKDNRTRPAPSTPQWMGGNNFPWSRALSPAAGVVTPGGDGGKGSTQEAVADAGQGAALGDESS